MHFVLSEEQFVVLDLALLFLQLGIHLGELE